MTLTQTESVVGVLGTFPRTGKPQVRLSAVSDLVAGEKRVGGEVIIFEHDGSPGPASTWRIFETGLFEIWIGTDRRSLELLWQACTAPYDWFRLSLKCPDVVEYGKEYPADIEFSYQIGRGKDNLKLISSR